MNMNCTQSLKPSELVLVDSDIRKNEEESLALTLFGEYRRAMNWWEGGIRGYSLKVGE
jgi:hypothetical protein